jgi:hypothetical protein
MNPNRSTSTTDASPNPEKKIEKLKPDSEPAPDTDLASLPPREREQLLDAERRDEMNEHDDARVDGKHYATPEQAEAIKEADAEPVSSDHLGARDEEMDRTQGPPATGTKPAEGKGVRPIPDAQSRR